VLIRKRVFQKKGNMSKPWHIRPSTSAHFLEKVLEKTRRSVLDRFFWPFLTFFASFFAFFVFFCTFFYTPFFIIFSSFFDFFWSVSIRNVILKKHQKNAKNMVLKSCHFCENLAKNNPKKPQKNGIKKNNY